MKYRLMQNNWVIALLLGLHCNLLWLDKDLLRAEAGETLAEFKYRWEAPTYAYNLALTIDKPSEIEKQEGTVVFTRTKQSQNETSFTVAAGLTSRTQPKEAGGLRYPNFPSFPAPRFGAPTVTLNSRGEVIESENLDSLPFLLATPPEIIFPILPGEPREKWDMQNSFTLTLVKRDDNAWPPRPPLGRSPFGNGFGGGTGPGRFGNSKEEKEVKANEKISYEVIAQDETTVTLQKTYEMKSTRLVQDKPQIEIHGTGTIHLDRTRHVSKDMDFKATASIRDANVTVEIPISLNFQLMTEAEWQAHQEKVKKLAEEHKKRVAEMQQKSKESQENLNSTTDEKKMTGKRESYNGPGTVTSTNRPVTESTKLKVGMVLQVKWGNSWYPAEVLELANDGRVKIHYCGWSNSWNEFVERNKLQLPPEDFEQPK